MSNKRVQISLELSESFLRLLKANLGLSDKLRPDAELDVLQLLGVVTYMEAAGVLPEQTYLRIPPEWRNDIEVLCDHRKIVI